MESISNPHRSPFRVVLAYPAWFAQGGLLKYFNSPPFLNTLLAKEKAKRRCLVMIIGNLSQSRPIFWQIEQCLIVDTPLNSALLFILGGSYTCQIISKMG
jgi:hypothetical protein